jgi:cytidyltransferase-like protein
MATNIFRAHEYERLRDKISSRGYALNIIMTGGYFNPLHGGHLDLLEDAAVLGDILIVAVNDDNASIRKHGYSFMPVKDRLRIIGKLRCVDWVVENPSDTVTELIRLCKPFGYAKGGDVTEENLCEAEKSVCEAVGTRIYYNVGGKKIASSSELIRQAYYHVRS